MTVDYYSLLMKAVAGKDAIARDPLVRVARLLVEAGTLTPDEAIARIRRAFGR